MMHGSTNIKFTLQFIFLSHSTTGQHKLLGKREHFCRTHRLRN